MKKKIIKAMALYMACNLLFEIIYPTAAYALTGGPSQPEFESFEPAGASEMVDLFSGDFNYNIPLMDVDGYPINLAYHANPTMDQEASWVGLGWNINPGTISRNVRGLPDDYEQDAITRKFTVKDNQTWGIAAGLGEELVGYDVGKYVQAATKAGIGVIYNNYKGLGFEINYEKSGAIGLGDKQLKEHYGGIGISRGKKLSSQEGASVYASAGIQGGPMNKRSGTQVGLNVGTEINSRQGLRYVAFSASAKVRGTNSKATLEGGVKTSSVVPIGTSTYIPAISIARTSEMYSGDFHAGIEAEYTSTFTYGRAYYIKQSIADEEKEKQMKGFGYLYSASATPTDPAALHDFNREKDGFFYETRPNMHLTNYTYDTYSATAQGLGSNFRPHRAEVGVVSDTYTKESSQAYSASGEASFGDILQLGLNGHDNFSHTTSGPWDNSGNNKSYNELMFQTLDNDGDREPVYFKAAGEKTPVDDDFEQLLCGTEPAAVKITKMGNSDIGAMNLLVSPNSASPLTDVYRTMRDKRKQVMSWLTGLEATERGLEKSILNYPMNNFELLYRKVDNATPLNRVDMDRPAHHISEISVLKEDGSRYVYGIPVSNTQQTEASFSVAKDPAEGGQSEPTVSCLNGTTNYTSTDNSLSNDRALDNFYESKSLPPYAHSYLITAVLSPDYVDVSGDGPSYDDLGSYTKFNYSKMDDAYQWRFPFSTESRIASYDRGFNSDNLDDKGNYLYGVKDVWYLHSIETKNSIAEFTLEERKDAFGANGENGGISSVEISKRLGKITLYNKQDILTNASNAVPIKTVHFEYDYSLCPGVFNNSGASETVDAVNRNANKGKLTLKKVYFTYGNSAKGAMSPYIFHYADPDHDLDIDTTYNPTYSPRNIDRWGYFKPCTATNSCAIGTDLNNNEFPYVDQDKTNADKYAAAWNLSDIETPSGGIIKIDYESDSYGYVQDEKAGQMMMIDGFSDEADDSDVKDKLYDFDGDPILGKPHNYNYMIVSLPNGDEVDNWAEFQQRYLGNNDFLYFKILTKIGKEDYQYDYVPGYADIDIAGCDIIGAGSPYSKVAIKLKEEGINDDKSHTKVNPIAKAAWQMGRMYLPKVVFPGSEPNSTGESALKGLIGSLQEAINMVGGINKVLLKRGVAKDIIPEKSWVRLYTPHYNKLGGGSRVHKILTNDNWNSMVASESSFDYGQEYTYDLYDNDVGGASSGVASYEPLIGGDEISLRKPVKFSANNIFAPDDSYFNEEPFGESFFPGAMVGYSRVKVKNIARTDVTHNATGHTEYKFYTAKDFPIITGRTRMDKQIIPPKAISKLTGRIRKKLATSQGFTIRLNDMHGKPKAQLVYEEGGTKPISGVEYQYRTLKSSNANPPDATLVKDELENTVLTVDKAGVIAAKVIGRDIDMVADARDFKSETYVRGGGAGSDESASSFGVPIVSFYPYLSSDKIGVRSIVTTKVVQTYGIIQNVLAYDNNSTVNTENILYDDETGDVLLTKTTNDYQDPVYSFTYPAHWVYDGMGPAYKNIGLILKNDGMSNAIDASTGEILAPYDALVMPGDEIEMSTYVLLPSPTNPAYHLATVSSDRYWISRDEVNAGHKLYLIDENGDAVAGTNPAAFEFVAYKVIRSGHRNQQGTPIGSIVALDDMQNGSDFLVDPDAADSKVLKASAMRFTDERSLLCGGSSNTENNCVEDLAFISDLQNMLDALAQNARFASSSTTNLYNTAPYSSYYSSLEAQVGCTPMMGMSSVFNYHAAVGNTATGTSFTAYFDCSIHICSLTVTSPTSITWANIIAFSDLHPVLGTPGKFTITAHITGGSTVVLTFNSCFDLENCTEDDTYTNCGGIGGTINPYLHGIRGNYRPLIMYNYLTDRVKGVTADIRVDGTYNSFKPFWQHNSMSDIWYPVNDANRSDYSSGSPFDKWKMTGKVDKVSKFGNTLETLDPIGRYSASLYGYHHTKNTANGNNAQYRQLGFDGFEDYEYNFVMAGVKCQNNHFSFAEYGSNVKNTQAHTGRFSMEVAPYSAVRMVRDIADELDTAHLDHEVPYAVDAKECAGTFSPFADYATDQTYVLSAWVKEVYSSSPGTPIFTYTDAQLVVNVNGTAVTPVQKRSNIINGWQKIEYTFTIPSSTSAGTISIGLVNISPSRYVYFDDVRIHPFHSTMQSYVYDPYSLRLWAELDDRNYATIYQYDEEGMLVRVNRETEKGIMTVKENRSSLIKR